MHLHPTFYSTRFPPGCSSDSSVGLERTIGKDCRRPLARSHKQGLSWLFRRKIPASKSTEGRWEGGKARERPVLSPIHPSLSQSVRPSQSAPSTLSEPACGFRSDISSEPSLGSDLRFGSSSSSSFQAHRLPPSPSQSSPLSRDSYVHPSPPTSSALCRSPRTKVRRTNRSSLVPSPRKATHQLPKHRPKEEPIPSPVEKAVWRVVEARKNVVLTLAEGNSGEGRRDSLRASVKGVRTTGESELEPGLDSAVVADQDLSSHQMMVD